MKFIGLRLCEHDSNITYVDGINVKYYKSERDYQIKHHGYKNLTGWTHLLKKWNIDPQQIDAVGIVLDCFRYPYIKCDEKKIIECIDIEVFYALGFNCPIYRIDHHYAHKLSIWPLNVKTDLDFVYDGFGDDKIVHTIFSDDKKILVNTLDECESLGILMANFGKIMNLSGNPLDFAGKLMALKGFSNIKKYDNNLNITDLNQVWDIKKFKKLTERQQIINFIGNSHEVTENIFCNHFLNFYKNNYTFSYSGGIAQNTIINTIIKEKIPSIHIPPHCNDDGLSLGIVECLRLIYNQPKLTINNFPFCQDDECPNEDPSDQLISETAELLANGKIVGWYQGHGEIGPRALGNRSILMDPSIRNGKEILNNKVKKREWFRPFGASILEEYTKDYFDWNDTSPYMLYVMEILNKQIFPSITHIDGTCRIQTVSSFHKNYYKLIDKFREITGIPMLLNTSLNNGGKPISGKITDALELLYSSDLDYLVVGNCIYKK